MPNNMITKYESGGKAPKKKMQMGGKSYGAGDGYITPRDANMNMMAKNGGLVGFPTGGSVLDGMMTYGGSSSKKSKKK